MSELAENPPKLPHTNKLQQDKPIAKQFKEALASSPVGPHARLPDNLRETERKAKSLRFTNPLGYAEYLKLDVLLSCVEPESRKFGFEAHDEHLFIIVHQAYELWFKQIIWEIDSCRSFLKDPVIQEKHYYIISRRFNRVVEIFRILVDQLNVLETMTPMGFLDFRDYIFPASGFQSAQFRLLENKLGLPTARRVKYGGKGYCSYLAKADALRVRAAAKESSVLTLVDRWLSRMPFLKFKNFAFWTHYQAAVKAMMDGDIEHVVKHKHISTEIKEEALAAHKQGEMSFNRLFDRDKFDAARYDHGFSYQAVHAALFIMLYSDEPLLQPAHSIIMALMDIDELMTRWRTRHALMVHRMLGIKIGTGGSSGFAYLKTTASRHRVFPELFNLSTFLIPRSALPVLPENLKKQLSYSFSAKSAAPDKGNGNNTPASMAAVIAENESLRRQVAALRLAALKAESAQSVTAAANTTVGVCPYGHS